MSLTNRIKRKIISYRYIIIVGIKFTCMASSYSSLVLISSWRAISWTKDQLAGVSVCSGSDFDLVLKSDSGCDTGWDSNSGSDVDSGLDPDSGTDVDSGLNSASSAVPGAGSGVGPGAVSDSGSTVRGKLDFFFKTLSWFQVFASCNQPLLPLVLVSPLLLLRRRQSLSLLWWSRSPLCGCCGRCG